MMMMKLFVDVYTCSYGGAITEILELLMVMNMIWYRWGCWWLSECMDNDTVLLSASLYIYIYIL